MVLEPERSQGEIEPEIQVVSKEEDVRADQRERPERAAGDGNCTGAFLGMKTPAARDKQGDQSKCQQTEDGRAEEGGRVARAGQDTTQRRSQKKAGIHKRAVDPERLATLIVRD